MKLIDGKALAEKIKDGITSEILTFSGPRPGLAIILIGDRPDSTLYVGLKEKQAKAVGIDTHVYRCDDDIKQADLISTIEFLNNDPAIDAILVQLPLPKHLDTDTIINTIKPEKDVDGFTKKNLEMLMSEDNNAEAILPPVYAVILAMLQSIDFSLYEKSVVLIANSDIFADNLAEVLRRQGAEVTLVENTLENISEKTLSADLLISAIGKPHYITREMVNTETVIIDIGISKGSDGKIKGDVDFENLQDIDGWVTPVPGGVGPMTIAMAFWNTLQMFKKNKNLLQTTK
ncbi:bifunctional 5,10-methylenetetrahydrofolate dehydrogenase/5,10-methenyltetrahydrofolate cyclohydrolase [Candidatus Falkowbacteria bacterium]|nr:MAG: bifunctional 5,10-methylenetetrahydrofolate dehydrogenase/5,10-methenyltetrahydrofolate cyclohydrolase [Candidatus Falkowbacteria bacterium]